MINPIRSLVPALVTSCFLSPAVSAAIVTYAITGVVTQVEYVPDPELSLFPGIAPGDQFVMNWTFDDAAAPCDTFSSSSRRYCNILEVVVRSGSNSETFAPPRPDLGYQDLSNTTAFGGSSSWNWFAIVGWPETSSFNRLTAGMVFEGPLEDGPLAASGLNLPRPDQLPINEDVIDISSFTYQHDYVSQFYGITTDRFSGKIVSVAVVPVPAGVPLLMSGLLLLTSVRRKSAAS